MNEDLQKKLRILGLNSSEIAVYLYLLQRGTAMPREIAKHTDILRTNCYGILENLIKRGLVNKRPERRHSTYIANNPSVLLRMLEERKAMVEQDLLPDLLNIFKSQDNKPVIRFYEGRKEVKDIFMQMYDSEEILGFASTKKVHNILPGFWDGWHKELKKRGIILKDILSSDSREKDAPFTKAALGELVEHRFLPPRYAEVSTDILVWNDSVALITLDEPIIGTVITNKQVASTFRVVLEIIWKHLGDRSGER